MRYNKALLHRFLLIAQQIALETEVTNLPAMKLYERLGFLRNKRLHRYYLNGNAAFRFLLLIKEPAAVGHDFFEDNELAEMKHT